MIVPFQAIMGFPFPITSKYMLFPFFEEVQDAADKDIMYNPTAFCVVEYPEKRIITYSRVNLPDKIEFGHVMSFHIAKQINKDRYMECLQDYILRATDRKNLGNSLRTEFGTMIWECYGQMLRIAENLIKPEEKEDM